MKTILVSLSISFALILSLVTGGAMNASSASLKSSRTTKPIKHLVVIFQENISFDHYFATYPYAKNPDGQPRFSASQKYTID
jgi:phospholipase C